MVARRRRLLIVTLTGLLVLVTSLAVVSAQGGGDHVTDLTGHGLGQVGPDGDEEDPGKGPPWTREGFQCGGADGQGRGGPPSVCGKDGQLLPSQAAGPGQAPGQGRGQGAAANAGGGFPGQGRGPAWARADFACHVSDDGGRGGPPWACGSLGAQSLDAQGGPQGPAWMP